MKRIPVPLLMVGLLALNVGIAISGLFFLGPNPPPLVFWGRILRGVFGVFLVYETILSYQDIHRDYRIHSLHALLVDYQEGVGSPVEWFESYRYSMTGLLLTFGFSYGIMQFDARWIILWVIFAMVYLLLSAYVYASWIPKHGLTAFALTESNPILPLTRFALMGSALIGMILNAGSYLISLLG